MFKKKSFLVSLILFILLNVGLFLFELHFHKVVPFDFDGYDKAHHYIEDPRIGWDSYNFFRGLDVWDAQWYIKIAEVGYPSKQNKFEDGTSMGRITYAFFPLYPSLLAMFTYFTGNTEMSAFILMNIFLLADFFCLYYIVAKLYDESIAIRTAWLLFLFPFSIFYRSYYTEGLFLFLLLWYSYFLIKKRWFLSVFFASLLFITRPNGIILGLILFFSLGRAVIKKELNMWKVLVCILLSLAFFSGWLYFNYTRAGDPFFWVEVQDYWYRGKSVFTTVFNNVQNVLFFFNLPFHKTHSSKVDVAVFVGTLVILVMSRKFLKTQLWWISFLTWVVPFLMKDTMSFSRYQIISFPLFIYLASIIKNGKFGITVGVLIGILFYMGLYLVNWYWLG